MTAEKLEQKLKLKSAHYRNNWNWTGT